MAVAVTVEDFFTRFPQFEDRDEDQLEALIAEASRGVDDRWDAADAVAAVLYLTAHLLVSEDSADSLPIISESLGPMSTTYARPTEDGSGLESTEYGRRYVRLRRKSFPGTLLARGSGQRPDT